MDFCRECGFVPQPDLTSREPIVQYGPFVMNSQQEIYQALSDFRDGRLGE